MVKALASKARQSTEGYLGVLLYLYGHILCHSMTRPVSGAQLQAASDSLAESVPNAMSFRSSNSKVNLKAQALVFSNDRCQLIINLCYPSGRSLHAALLYSGHTAYQKKLLFTCGQFFSRHGCERRKGQLACVAAQSAT